MWLSELKIIAFILVCVLSKAPSADTSTTDRTDSFSGDDSPTSTMDSVTNDTDVEAAITTPTPSHLTEAEIAGIVLGSCAGVALIGGAGFYGYKHKSKKNKVLQNEPILRNNAFDEEQE
ncbi:uncharacterized protein LOC143469327 isoform X2 [Clavelina lepadiformis]|uniref:uncharacterized protein LOC143469327 isoform X2 n=1 Tax=Clavelina lepadiformis TaxID=159417 RepID=UPI0040421C90